MYTQAQGGTAPQWAPRFRAAIDDIMKVDAAWFAGASMMCGRRMGTLLIDMIGIIGMVSIASFVATAQARPAAWAGHHAAIEQVSVTAGSLTAATSAWQSAPIQGVDQGVEHLGQFSFVPDLREALSDCGVKPNRSCPDAALTGIELVGDWLPSVEQMLNGSAHAVVLQTVSYAPVLNAHAKPVSVNADVSGLAGEQEPVLAETSTLSEPLSLSLLCLALMAVNLLLRSVSGSMRRHEDVARDAVTDAATNAATNAHARLTMS